MDEYADFVEASLRACDRTHAARQKALGKRIITPFRMGAEKPQPKNEPRIARMTRIQKEG
jgi:hypothetical protein